MCWLVATVSDLSRSFVKPILNHKLANTSQLKVEKWKWNKLNWQKYAFIVLGPASSASALVLCLPDLHPALVGGLSWGPPSPQGAGGTRSCCSVIIMTMIMIISRAHIDLYPIIAAGRRAHKTAQTTCQEVLTRGSSSSSSCPLSLERIIFDNR